MQDASSSRRGWPKKSKLVVEKGTTAGSVVEDGFSSLDSYRNDAVGDGLGNFGSDVDGEEE